MLPRPDAPAKPLPYTTVDMSKLLAKKKAEYANKTQTQANQALRYGVTNPPAPTPEPEKSGGGWWPSWGEIGNAGKSLVLTPAGTALDMIPGVAMLPGVKGKGLWGYEPEDAGTSNFFQAGGQGLEQAGRRAVGDFTALPFVGKPSPSYTADQIRQKGWFQGLGEAALDYGNLAATAAPFAGPVAKSGINSYRLIKSGFADDLARFRAGNDAGVLGYGGRERPQINLTGQPKPRLTADQLFSATGESPFAQGIGDIIKNTVQDVPRANPTAGAKMPPSIMEDFVGKLTSELDSIPEWMKTKVEKPQIQRPINEPMTPAKAQQYATPIGNQNQIWPSNWDNVNLSKEIDLTRRFANASEAAMAGKDAANKWGAQKAFRDQIVQQIENGNISSFNSNVFPSYIKTPQDMIRFVEISDLSTLINNPIMAADYIDLMRLFNQ
jgi:hypothetical protein